MPNEIPPPPRVVITGGSSRLGFAIALRCRTLGFDCIIPTRSTTPSELTRFLADNPQERSHFKPVICDISKDPTPLFDILGNERIAGFVHAAAYFGQGDISNFNSLDVHLSINAIAPVKLITHLVAHNGLTWGITISDALISPHNARFQNYRISKRLLEELTMELAERYRGIVRINCIAPGPILSRNESDTAFFAKMEALSPEGRLPSVNELTDVLQRIIEDEGKTGEIILVDAGLASVY